MEYSEIKKKRLRKTSLNAIALRLAIKLYGVEDLHVGYWDGLSIVPENLVRAQQRFSEEVASYIPEGVQTILDVGCGVGHFAQMLIEKGYSVECLTPDPFQIEQVQKRLGEKVRIHKAYFERFSGPQIYDLILMSESSHCINRRTGLKRVSALLKGGRYLLIADFFRIHQIDVPYVSKAGHKLQGFIDTAKESGLLLRKQIDISQQIGPSLLLWQNFINDKIFPVAEAFLEAFQNQLPKIYKILRFFLRKKVAFAWKKMSSQDPESIGKYKRYYILLFQKQH